MYEHKTLSEIVKQLESCKYECEGGALENNIAFTKLKEIADKVSVPLGAVVILQRTNLEKIAQMVCDTENQPHQYIGDIEGFTELLKEKIAKNCLADFNDAVIDIVPDSDYDKVNAIYNRLLSALSK